MGENWGQWYPETGLILPTHQNRGISEQMSGFGDYKCNGADFATISRQNNCWLSSVWGRYLQFLEQNTCGRGLQVNSHDVWGKTRLTLRITYCIGFWCFSCGIQVLFFWITNHLKSWATYVRFPIQFHHHSSDLATWGCYHLSIYIYIYTPHCVLYTFYMPTNLHYII